jgi:rare lipoprotein A
MEIAQRIGVVQSCARHMMAECRAVGRAALWGGVALIAACASTPPAQRDGPPEKIPAELGSLRDAEPRVEPIRSGGPNRPYEVFGRDYVPITQDVVFRERGLASWYGRKFHGRRTANGEVYDMFAMTAAHPTLPIPSYARVINPSNGRTVILRINDRGPFHAGRVIDLSYAAAFKLDLLRGVAPVVLERITFGEIRSGAWQRAVGSVVPMEPPAAPPAGAGAELTPPQVTLNAPSVPAPPRVLDIEIAVPTLDPSPGPGFWIQLGAFRLSEGALAFRRRVAAELEWLEPLLIVFRDEPLVRLQAGPFENRARAQRATERIRETLKLVPMIVERQ